MEIKDIIAVGEHVIIIGGIGSIIYKTIMFFIRSYKKLKTKFKEFSENIIYIKNDIIEIKEDNLNNKKEIVITQLIGIYNDCKGSNKISTENVDVINEVLEKCKRLGINGANKRKIDFLKRISNKI